MKASELSKFKLCYEYREDLPEIQERIKNYRSKVKKRLSKKK